MIAGVAGQGGVGEKGQAAAAEGPRSGGMGGGGGKDPNPFRLIEDAHFSPRWNLSHWSISQSMCRTDSRAR